MKHIILIVLVMFCGVNFYSQQNVGVGTLTPNPKAVLDIESTDKGLLIPRLTTAQRNIFGVGLTNTENSMLVYDVNDSVFYYWKATVWIPIPGVNTDDQNIDSVRLNPLDSVLTVYIEDGLSASVDLKTAFDNKDEQLLSIVGDSLEISNGNKVLFIDNDTTNEKIDSITYLNDTLIVYEGNNIYKTEMIGGTDEQILTIIGDSLEISNGNNVLFIDNDTTNEKIDSVTYQNDTLIVYEGDSIYKTEIVGGEWSDADKIGMTNFIYAKQALTNGTPDTVVVTDDGKMGIGTSNPLADLHILRPVGKSQIRLETDKNNTNPEDDTPGITLHQDGDLVKGYLGYIHGAYTPFTQPVFGAVGNSFITVANDLTNGFVSIQHAINDTVAMTIDNKRNIGIGTNTPSERLELNEGGLQINQEFGIGFNGETPNNGVVTGDRARIYYDNNFFGANIDGLVIEKTDGNEIDPDLGNSGIAFTMKGNDNIRETPMVIKGNNRVGINTLTPTDALQINGNVRVGVYKELPGGAVEPEGWGNVIHFSGGPDVSPTFNSDNSDGFWIGRYNIASDVSELRIRLGDNESNPNNDAFVIGSALTGVHAWRDYFRVQSNGFTGIGVNPATYPTNQLHVIANTNPLRLEGLQQGAPTDSVLTVNNTGVVRQSANPMPAGSIISFAGAAAPAGFLICDGSAVSRTDYADLFAVVGTTYGVGNGTTTFNIPDLRGEFIRGADAGKGTDPGRALGSNQVASPVVGDDNVGAPDDFSMQVNGASPQFFDNYDASYAAINFWYKNNAPYQYNISNGAGFLRGSRPRNVALNYIIRY